MDDKTIRKLVGNRNAVAGISSMDVGQLTEHHVEGESIRNHKPVRGVPNSKDSEAKETLTRSLC